MTARKPDVVRGSRNVFRDVGHKDADAARFKAVLAAARLHSRRSKAIEKYFLHELAEGAEAQAYLRSMA